MDETLRLAALTHAEHNVAYAEALAGRVSRTDDVVAVDIASPAFFLNALVPTRPLPAGSVADAARGFFGARPHLVVDYFAALDLSAAGYEHIGTMPVMVRPPAPLDVPAGDLDVTLVRDVDGLQRFERVVIDGMEITPYADAPPFALWGVGVLDRPTLRLYLGSHAGRAVSCAAAVVLDDGVGVFAVATLHDTRRRGYGAILTAAAVNAAPGVPAVLTASLLGRGVYERLGFTEVGLRHGWRSGGSPPSDPSTHR